MSTPQLFVDAQGGSRILRGISLYCNSPQIADLAGQLGFDVVWLDMEHGPLTYSDAEGLCYAIRASGAQPLVRLPDGERHHVLRALEIGARIIVVAMVNTPDQARQIVKNGKFPPVGQRGLNSNTPGNRFGLDGLDEMLKSANEATYLFAQIETREAVENITAICQVDGLDGIFIGPSDLALSYGWAGQLTRPELIEIAASTVSTARKAGKLAGILASPGPLLGACVNAGCQLTIVGSDIAELTTAWHELLQQTA